jgi:hypothetical protein
MADSSSLTWGPHVEKRPFKRATSNGKLDIYMYIMYIYNTYHILILVTVINSDQ